MVRSSSSKSTTEKKTQTSKTAKTAPKAGPLKKTASARSGDAASVKGTKAESKRTNAVQAKTPKAKPQSESTGAATISKAAKPAGKAARTASAEPSKVKKTSKAPAPKTHELFDDSVTVTETPEVSIFPSIDARSADDAEPVDAQSAMPPEFRESPIHSFGEEESAELKLMTPAEPEKEVTFSFLGFSDAILDAVRKQNFHKPTRVQALCLPHTLDGKDVAGFAQTGTGKTAVYLLTAAQKLLSQENRVINPKKPHILVVVPTRELADQVCQDARKLLSPLKLKSMAAFGGVDVEKHVSELSQPIDIIVATPGRLLDLHRSKNLEFDDLQMLVIDECDRMFDMGFIDDVEYVLRHLPAERVQKLLFSATGSEKVKELAFEYLEEPEYIETDPVRISPEKISQVAYAVTAEQKFLTLMGHLREHNPECGIIFTNTKVVAEWVGYKLACNGLNAEVLTGDLPQRKRMTLIKKIKEGKCNLLVATDVLSRGLHVANLSHVYNFDIPDDAESFIHRIGRTARAGATGHAVTLICDDYGFNMGDVETLLGFKIPLADVPQSYLSAEDVSDYPFDENGRVKVFGQQASTGKDTTEHREREERRSEHSRPAARESEVPLVHSGRPEPTLPHHRREAVAGKGHSAAHPQRQADRPVPASAAAQGPVANGAAASSAPVPAAASMQRHQQSHAAGAHGGQQATAGHRPHAHAKTGQPVSGHSPKTQQSAATQGTFAGSGMPRRDEKAKETIEMAIQAAKKAAAKRRSAVSSASAELRSADKDRRGRVTSQIDEFAATIINTAQERLGGTFGHLQDRFVSRFEENFPRLSETLVRLGFFSKRFTDDR
jgi:ATP-dependent RNA helicase RhlB